jgi:hypothetical protein
MNQIEAPVKLIRSRQMLFYGVPLSRHSHREALNLLSPTLFQCSHTCINQCIIVGHRICFSPPKSSALLTLPKDITVLVHIWYPLEPDRKQCQGQPSLFELAMSRAALFHAIMCSSALYLNMVSGCSESSQSITHKVEAIHLINTQLQDMSGMSDAIIGAVPFLAKIEVRLCTSKN